MIIIIMTTTIVRLDENLKPESLMTPHQIQIHLQKN